MSHCKLCNQESTETSHSIKHFVMDYIASTHPSWIKDDGSCPKCEQFYENDLSNTSSSLREY